MENSIYLGLSRQTALKSNLEIIANNVANMNTPGFRGQNLVFAEYLSDPRGSDDALSFVTEYGQYDVTESGPVNKTDNPFTVALNGPGFLGVIGPNEEQTYTRAGNFEISSDGTLVTSSGFPVASAGGAPINIPQGSTEFKIDERGFISNQDGQIGRLQVVEFENLQSLDPLGNNLYRANADPVEATETVVKQGFLEGSNVKPVVEMTRMIETLRSFQSVQNLLKSENERLRTAIRVLTQQ